jgi:hypothetical protein
MNTVVICNIQDKEVITRLRYTLEKQGFYIQEEYHGDSVTLVFWKKEYNGLVPAISS